MLSQLVARAKNQLSNTEAALEAAKMENVSLMNQIVEVSKREDKLQSQIRSQLANQDMASKKLDKIERNSQALEQEITMLKAQLAKFEETYKSVCQDVQAERERNQRLVHEINDLKQKQTLWLAEKDSYGQVLKTVHDGHNTIMNNYGSEILLREKCQLWTKTTTESEKIIKMLQRELGEVRVTDGGSR